MNKKSAILFFSVLFLVGVIFYAIAGEWDTTPTVTTDSTGGESFSAYAVANWLKGNYRGEILNFTLIMNSDINDVNNVTYVEVAFDNAVKATHQCDNDTAGLVEAFVYAGSSNTITETWPCNGTTMNEIYYGGVGGANLSTETTASNWSNWTCWSAGTSQLGQSDRLRLALNVTTDAIADESEDLLNYTFIVWTANLSEGNATTIETNLFIDDQSPRLIEVNISDGNTTYHNSTWDTVRIMNGPLRIEALIEDSQLGNAVVLGYNCNSSNGTFAETNGGYAVNAALAVTNQGVGTTDQKGSVASSWIDCSSWNIAGGNETFNFNFLANDTLNHLIELNDSSAASQGAGSFQVILDDGELLPVIAKVNVTQTTKTGSDGLTSITTSLEHGAGLDGSSDYLAANTVTFGIELTGGQKPNEVWIAWNDTGAATTHFGPAVIGGSNAYFGAASYNLIDDTAALNASSVSHVSTVDSSSSANATTVVYSTTLNLAGNSSTDFVFWVYANNTGDNYTRLSGPHRFQIDSGVPSITMTPPTDRTITPRGSITYSCTESDSLSGTNKIMWQLKKPGETVYTTKQSYADVVSGSDSITFTGDDTNLAGTYEVQCLAIDTVGNEGTYTASSTENFAVHYSTTEAGVGAGEGAGAAADLDFTTQEEITVKEKQGVITTFTLDGTTVHTIKIKTVDEIAGTVTIVIESDPITITLKIGETKEVDIDADGENDISVTLNGITDGAADITTKRLTPLPTEKPTEEVPPTGAPEEITPTPEAASKTWLWILIIVIIVVIGAGYWFMKRK